MGLPLMAISAVVELLAGYKWSGTEDERFRFPQRNKRD
jgi:hypothetical protein